MHYGQFSPFVLCLQGRFRGERVAHRGEETEQSIFFKKTLNPNQVSGTCCCCFQGIHFSELQQNCLLGNLGSQGDHSTTVSTIKTLKGPRASFATQGSRTIRPSSLALTLVSIQ